MKTIKCIVAGVNANGEPDLYFCRVQCTPDQYDEGHHYDYAKKAAAAEGYEGEMVAFDEFDHAGAVMLGLFCWESLSDSIACP